MLFVILNHSQIIFSLCRRISSRLYVYLISNQKVLILLTSCFWGLSIIIQSQSPFVTPSSLASPPLTFLFNPKRQTVILGDHLDLLSLLLRKSKCLVKEVFEPDGRRRRIEKWQREGSPGRGRHVCKVVKISTCEVYLRRYQITRLEHEVREREFWKIWLERLVNQDREDLESQIKEFRCSFGIRWGFGIEHSGRMCVGGRSLWWMNYRRGTVEVEKPTMDFSNIIFLSWLPLQFLKFYNLSVYASQRQELPFTLVSSELRTVTGTQGCSVNACWIECMRTPGSKNIRWLFWVYTADSDRSNTKNCSWPPVWGSFDCDVLSCPMAHFSYHSCFFPPCQLLS